MVRLTREMVARGTSGYMKRRRDETFDQFMSRLTHLYLENKGLSEIGDELAQCNSLMVLYLYDNTLSKIPHLNQGSTLTHLYLQNNSISHIEGLNSLVRLTKLYLGGNCITVIEGLEALDQLQELHVEHQKLPPGEKVLFDPRTVRTLANCLQILNISGNHVDDVSDLRMLRELTQFLAGDNDIQDLRSLLQCVRYWPRLWRLEIAGNPVVQRAKCRDKLILSIPRLEMLDGKAITDQARSFLQNWEASKQATRQRLTADMSADGLRFVPGMGLLSSAPVGMATYSTHNPQPNALPVTRKRVRTFLARSKSLQNPVGLSNVAYKTSLPSDGLPPRHLNSHTYNSQLLEEPMGPATTQFAGLQLDHSSPLYTLPPTHAS